MKHPYADIPDYARWDRAIATQPPSAVDPVVRCPFTITPAQAVVTAGSCFAQHIARYLKQAGFNFLVTEPGHPMLEHGIADAFNYGVFSARFGNIYTSRQLEQLWRRAYGGFEPHDSAWERPDGRLVDPFRPTIQPGGFRTRQELEADRRQHLAAVRRAFEQLEVLVFTLGLTECWMRSSDGAVFPVAPGVAGGVFAPERYVLLNLDVNDVVADMTRFIVSLRERNAAARVILTVSPVPLNATALDRHVLVSTTYSKAVLRVAAEMLATSIADVHYFPAYEIVTGNFSRGSYFSDDLRSVTESGVEHVMSLFFRHGTTGGAPASVDARSSALSGGSPPSALEKAVDVLCDEELLTLDADSRPR